MFRLLSRERQHVKAFRSSKKHSMSRWSRGMLSTCQWNVPFHLWRWTKGGLSRTVYFSKFSSLYITKNKINTNAHDVYLHVYELKEYCVLFLKYLLLIMDTMFDVTEEEKKIRTEFYSPKTYSMAEASSLPNCARLCFGPVQENSVKV